MKLEDFKRVLKSAKRDVNIYSYDYKCKVFKGRYYWNIYSNKVCSKCGHEQMKEIFITFDKPISLSIFQANLLFALFCLNKIPYDYAQYHNCIAGKEFIKSIVRIT